MTYQHPTTERYKKTSSDKQPQQSQPDCEDMNYPKERKKENS
jgi:hypothetical protein